MFDKTQRSIYNRERVCSDFYRNTKRSRVWRGGVAPTNFMSREDQYCEGKRKERGLAERNGKRNALVRPLATKGKSHTAQREVRWISFSCTSLVIPSQP